MAKKNDQPSQVPTDSPVDWTNIDVPDHQILRTRLDDVQRLCGQRFTLDATCSTSGKNKQFPRSCASDGEVNSVGSFHELSSLKGEHVWMNLCSEQVSPYLSKYLDLKKLYPTTVSGCFLVPYRPDCEWFQSFSHMQLLKEYPTGASLFYTQDGSKRTYLRGNPGVMRIYYDPPDPSIGAGHSKPKFLLRGKIFSSNAKILIDNGANTQYIGADTCKKMGGTVTQLAEQPRSVQVGDGRFAEVIGACRVPVTVGAYKGFVTALVLDKFSAEFDLVLGESWLKAYKAQLNYGAYSALRLRVANRVVIIKVGQRGKQRDNATLNALVSDQYEQQVRAGNTPEGLITTATQLKNALRSNRSKYFMINVRYKEQTDGTPGAVYAINSQVHDEGRQEVSVEPEPVPFDHPLDTAGVYSAEPSSIRILAGEVVVEAKQLEALLNRYKDVFPEALPYGMPPDRNVVHPITLEDNAKPSYRPMYRLSPDEKEECEVRTTG